MHSYKDLGRVERITSTFYKIFLPGTFLPFHIFTAADNGLPHCHPSDIEVNILEAGYEEEVFTIHDDGSVTSEFFERLPNTTYFIPANRIHRITKLFGDMVVTRADAGPPYRTWAIYDFRPDGVYFRPNGEEHFRRYENG